MVDGSLLGTHEDAMKVASTRFEGAKQLKRVPGLSCRASIRGNYLDVDAAFGDVDECVTEVLLHLCSKVVIMAPLAETIQHLYPPLSR